MARIAVVGSRRFYHLEKVRHFIRSLPWGTVVISGGARGVDSIAVETAADWGLSAVEFLPNYGRYGRKAPLVRNEQIAQECDGMVAFWDGHSRGTMHAVCEAEKRGKPVWIHKEA